MTAKNRRILVVDDMPEIHDDFKRILARPPSHAAATHLDDDEAILFGRAEASAPARFEIDSAYTGREALQKVERSVEREEPYALAIVDMRMPPGWGGVETIRHLWEADPRVQVAICTAYSDLAWDEVLHQLEGGPGVTLLRKPFEPEDVLELAESLTGQWSGPAAA
ncbi:response regulator [Ramlibacter sp.]|uniref:response regulator n=1 Tax=Ramlibacter sp. TaxID=1917967 RepID=UPI003D0F35E8